MLSKANITTPSGDSKMAIRQVNIDGPCNIPIKLYNSAKHNSLGFRPFFYGIVVITILLFVALAMTTDGFETARNIMDQQSTILIAASFMTVAIIAGNFDVSVSSIFVTAPLFALFIENTTGSAVWAVAGALCVGLVLGTFNGVVVTRFKINSFIATLATSFMFFGVGYLISDRSMMRPDGEFYQQIARTRVLGITSGS